MNLIFLILTLFGTNFLYAQTELSLLQSPPAYNWMEIENDYFRIIFPKDYEAYAQKTLKLLMHHKKEVEATYNTVPEKIFLVLRPDMATPNGFVTLAPRRSEWFHNASVSPLVGSLDWLHSLAVHEYRHIVQYKYLSESKSIYGYYLFGENILNFLIHMVMPTWYFEGDAVWTETVFTDGGRGRSPRFSSRLKALVTSSQKLEYDRLLGQDYNQNLPNLYVYGYYLITYGMQKYGKNFWQNVALFAKDKPWNPWAVYNAFKIVTGVEFEDFYTDALKDLKNKWGTYPLKDKVKYKRYTQISYPFKTDNGLYYLQKEDGKYWGLYHDDIKLTDLALSPNLSRVDLYEKYLIYSQITPHPRYSYSEEQNLYLYDIEKDKIFQITKNKKYIHPKFSPLGNMISAVNHNDKGIFSLHILNLKGEILHKLHLKDESLSEAIWIDDENLAIIIINSNGEKRIARYNIQTAELQEVLPSSRNNIYSLFYHKNQVYFEADYKGAVNIFKVGIKDLTVSQCSFEFIKASHPFIADKLFYVSEIATGQIIKSKKLECKNIKQDELVTSSKYISQKDPSDHYYNASAKPIDIKKLKSIQAQSKKSSDLNGLIKPHSWSFIGDRGYQLQGLFTNNLGNTNMNFALGQDSEESTPFFTSSISYAKYYPLLSLSFNAAERSLVTSSGNTANWNEQTLLAGITLPYLYQKNLWQSLSYISHFRGEVSVTDNPFNTDTYLSDEKMQVQTTILVTGLTKYLRKRDIRPSLGFDFQLSYSTLERESETTENFYTQSLTNLYLPSFWEDHSINFSLTQELRPNSKDMYRLQKNHYGLINYLFSRGYAYEFSSRFDKYSFEYALPISYPNYSLKDYFYFNRIYINLFYDTTLRFNEMNEDEILISKGLELNFNTNSFRKFPLYYGLRFIDLQSVKSNQVELFVGVGI